MFRIDMLDDYTALKPLIDYNWLNELVDRNADLLDEKKVREFKNRYAAEQAATGAARTDSNT